MKISDLIGERYKDNPSNVTFKSHLFLLKGGYIKMVGNGIFSLFTPMKRIVSKIENIIREEMDLVGGQEVLLPVALPSSLWEESGRYKSVGAELLRFKDRNNASMVLGMTHEEAAVQLIREYANTYSRYPFMIYQIQTKFRDEKRPRAGLIRVREFTMKDAYSFHTSKKSLEEWYDKILCSYNRIFSRCGIPETVCVRGDSGMMGGNISHEFMLITDAGEDSLAICENCDFKSNVEACECNIDSIDNANIEELKEVYTPDINSIDDLSKYLNISPNKILKSVAYELESNSYINNKEYNKGDIILTFIRGDLEVNQTKVSNIINANIIEANLNNNSSLVPGFIGPINLPKNKNIAAIIYDKSVNNINSLVCGANKKDYHYTGLNINRDIGEISYYDIAMIKDGMKCPSCKKHSIKIVRGIEVGNIFQLGTKYSIPMHLNYTDENGKINPAIMGCYGIGVGRLAASVLEVKNDENGPIWPISIAPWQVHICNIRVDNDECKKISDKIYSELLNRNIEVIYDDRKDVRAGEMFADADLLGCPIRVIISPRNIKNNTVEIITRDKSLCENVPVDETISYIINLKNTLFSNINKYIEKE